MPNFQKGIIPTEVITVRRKVGSVLFSGELDQLIHTAGLSLMVGEFSGLTKRTPLRYTMNF